MTQRIWNKNRSPYPSDAVYIGRGSPWGNPYSHMHGTKAEFTVATRREAIMKYAQNVLPKLDLTPLIGKHLLCYCHPLPCHGQVILAKLERLERENLSVNDSQERGASDRESSE